MLDELACLVKVIYIGFTNIHVLYLQQNTYSYDNNVSIIYYNLERIKCYIVITTWCGDKTKFVCNWCIAPCSAASLIKMSSLLILYQKAIYYKNIYQNH